MPMQTELPASPTSSIIPVGLATENTFHQGLSQRMLQGLRAAPWLSIVTHTTSVSALAPPMRVGNETSVGVDVWGDYRGKNTRAILNVQPRLRVVTAFHEDLGSHSWDLDGLSLPDRSSLLTAMVADKTIIVHDAIGVLSSLFAETESRPAFIIDLMLLAKHLQPGFLLKPFKLLKRSRGEDRTRLTKIIEEGKGRPASTIEWLAIAAEVPVPDQRFVTPHAWSVSPLSKHHYHFTRENAVLQHRLALRLLSGKAILECEPHFREKYPWFLAYMTASKRLAEAHIRGVPVNIAQLDLLKSELTQEVEKAADALTAFPAFKNLREHMIKSDSANTDVLKSALELHASESEVTLPKTKHGSTSTDASEMRYSGASELAAWPFFKDLRNAKHCLAMINRIASFASDKSRLHSCFSFDAATSRLNSRSPALYNMPRDPRVRGLIQAPTGYSILSVDYASIELRIGAFLAERAISELRAILDEGVDTSDFIRLVRKGVESKVVLQCVEEPHELDSGWRDQAIPVVSRRVFNRPRQTMMAILDNGLDPHLIAALEMLRLEGKLSFTGSAIDHLRANPLSLPLTGELTAARQKAKAVNFGLLYGQRVNGLHRLGITDYGLSWSKEDARKARENWFHLFPEFRLLHWFIEIKEAKPLAAEKYAVWDAYEEKIITPSSLCYFDSRTACGRRLVVLKDLTKALNYQNQGTGADILAHAISSLPDSLAKMLVFTVHDELIFEVPNVQLAKVTSTVESVMVESARQVLQYGVPIKVENHGGQAWTK